jgi:hypothetical protein
MARIRSINPCAPLDEDVATMSIGARLLWAFLPCHADRDGRLRDSAFTLKTQIMPADPVDVEVLLKELAERRHIIRYEVDGRRYIQIRNFRKHQNPHKNETPSTIPPVPEAPQNKGLTALPEEPRSYASTPETQQCAPADPSPDPSPSPDLLSQSAREEPAPLTGPPDPLALPKLPTGEVNGHGLARMFGIVRAREIQGALPWEVPKDRSNKGDAIADTIAGDLAARADVIPSMVLFFKRAKAGEIGQGGKAVSDPSYGFACWVSGFTALREALSGKGPSAPPSMRSPDGPRAPYYHSLKPLPAGVPRPRP